VVPENPLWQSSTAYKNSVIFVNKIFYLPLRETVSPCWQCSAEVCPPSSAPLPSSWRVPCRRHVCSRALRPLSTSSQSLATNIHRGATYRPPAQLNVQSEYQSMKPLLRETGNLQLVTPASFKQTAYRRYHPIKWCATPSIILYYCIGSGLNYKFAKRQEVNYKYKWEWFCVRNFAE